MLRGALPLYIIYICLPETHVKLLLSIPSIHFKKAILRLYYYGYSSAYPYLHEVMGAAYTVADLVVCRAGATTLGDLPSFGIPVILVPYPYAWRYRQVNAQYLAQRGAAVVLSDSELPAELLPSILRLMEDHEALLRMHAAMKSVAQPQAAKAIADQLRLLAEDSRR